VLNAGKKGIRNQLIGMMEIRRMNIQSKNSIGGETDGNNVLEMKARAPLNGNKKGSPNSTDRRE